MASALWYASHAGTSAQTHCAAAREGIEIVNATAANDQRQRPTTDDRRPTTND